MDRGCSPSAGNTLRRPFCLGHKLHPGGARAAHIAWVAQEASAANKVLIDPPEGWQPADTLQVLKVISQELGSEQEATRLAALHWMTTLLTHSRATVGLPLPPVTPRIM